MSGEGNGEIICPSCGLRNRAGANFCGGCGDSLRVGLVCKSCGAAVEGAYRFCGRCGGRVDGGDAAAIADVDDVVGRAASASQSAPLFTSLALPKRAVGNASTVLSRRLVPAAVTLLALGALLVALAQAYLTLANEPSKDAPALGIFALAAGFALFALGAFGRSGSDDTPDALDRVNIPALQSLMGRLTAVNVAALGVGFIAMAMLTFRLLSGSDSGWDMLLWLIAIGAFAVPFIRRSSISLPSCPNAFAPFGVSIPRRYYADIVIVIALVGVFVGLNTHDLTDWYYSALGDEYAHYNFARDLAENGLRRPFDLDGVYSDINPVMTSIYPAVVMRLFGIDNFGWKLSLIISVAVAIPGMYILGHVLAGRAGAFVAAAVLAFSHYILAFMHTGYPNTDVLPIIVWAIALFALGIRRGSSALMYAGGVVAGIGILMNIVANAAIAVSVLYALSHSGVRKRVISLLPWALGVALTAAPMLIANQDYVISFFLAKIVGPGSQHASEYDSALSRILANAAQNLTAFNYNSRASHYVSGSLLDPVSAVLATLGLAYCLGTVSRASSRLMLILFAVLATGTALLSPYPYVPITRMSGMLIPLALMAGVLVARFSDGAVSPSTGATAGVLGGRALQISALSILAAAVLALNAWQFWVATPQVFQHTREAVAIGAMRSDACEGAAGDVVVLGRTTIPLLKPALESYHPNGPLPHLLDHSDIEANRTPPESPRCVVLMNPSDEEIQSFKQDLASRFPEGRFSIFANPSNTTSVEVFVLSAR